MKSKATKLKVSRMCFVTMLICIFNIYLILAPKC